MDTGQVNIALHGDNLVFYGKVPGNIKRKIRKRFREDEQFRKEVMEKLDNAGLAK